MHLRDDLRDADLLQQILAPYQVDRPEAAALIAYAKRQHLDVLQLCAARFEIDEPEIYARAARILGLAFHHTIPTGTVQMRQVDRLEQLPNIRQVRGKIYDRSLVYAAPTLEKFVSLARQLRHHPEIRSSLCIVPLRALRQSLQVAQNAALYTGATQRLARVWPQASAHLGLGRYKRFLFLGAVLSVALLSAWDPPYLEILIFIFLAMLYVGPAAFRLYASLYGVLLGPPARTTLLEDAALPIYTVMVPLYNEANLVPQLAEALKALNYPDLCIKRTKFMLIYN